MDDFEKESASNGALVRHDSMYNPRARGEEKCLTETRRSVRSIDKLITKFQMAREFIHETEVLMRPKMGLKKNWSKYRLKGLL